MPMPPALAKEFAYSSLRNERHTPAPPPPPKGPSPSMPVNIWLNICERNMPSKATESERALALGSSMGLAPEEARGPEAASAPSAAVPGFEVSDATAAISHHLDIGLDRARGLDRLQDRDHVA